MSAARSALVAASSQMSRTVSRVLPSRRTARSFNGKLQELCLQGEWQGTDLVQEERSVMGGLKEAIAGHPRVSECPPFVTEELCFQQCLRDRGAVDGNERGLRSATRSVHRPRQKGLPRSCLAEQKDRGESATRFQARQEPFERGGYAAKPGASANQIRERRHGAEVLAAAGSPRKRLGCRVPNTHDQTAARPNYSRMRNSITSGDAARENPPAFAASPPTACGVRAARATAVPSRSAEKSTLRV